MENYIMGLAHICIVSKDLIRSKEFYCGILGFEVEHENTLHYDAGDISLCFIKNGGLTLELAKFEFAVDDRQTGHHDHIGFAVKDIDRVASKLKEAGVVFETEQPADMPQLFDNGCRGIAFAGPDGERLELSETL